MMTTVQFELPNDMFEKLQEVATRYDISTEALIRASIEQFLAAPEPSFSDALELVLEKNEALYRRLA